MQEKIERSQGYSSERPTEGHLYIGEFDICPQGVGASHKTHRERFRPKGLLTTEQADALAIIEAEAFQKEYRKEHPNDICALQGLYRCFGEEPVLSIYPYFH